MSTAPSPSASGTKKRKVIASPIRPSVLSWVIEESGYGVAELAATVGVSASELSAWSRGDEVAPRGKVSEILRKLHRSPDMVYLDEVPEEARLKAHFRTMKVAGGTVPLTPEEVRVIREAHYVQYMMSDIMRRSEEVIPSVNLRPNLGIGSSSQSRGRSLRHWVEAENHNEAGRTFTQWRELVEARSIFVMAVNIPRTKGWVDRDDDDPSKLRGFSLPGDWAPLIVVCTDSQPAKSFTLFHELAHLGLSHDPSGSCHVPISSADSTERLCDEIAGAALVPLDALRSFVKSRNEHDPDGLVKAVSNRFKVSMRAAAVAVENGLGYRGLYRRVDSYCTYRDRVPRSGSGGGPGFGRVDLRLQKYGRGLVRRLLSHFATGMASERQVRRLLKLDIDGIYDAASKVGVEVP